MNLPDTIQMPLVPISFAELLRENPPPAAPVIDGLLREAAVGTISGGSKTRKSWLMAMLVVSVLTGRPWLGHTVKQGRVLLIDGELTRSALLFRLQTVFEAMSVSFSNVASNLEIQVLRGRTDQFNNAIRHATECGPRFYRLIIVDPLSCFYPRNPQFSENSNSDMRRVYDDAIRFADVSQAAVMIVHHFSKGSQVEKSVTDLGAGAGAIARATDAHIGLRPHREKDVLVLDSVVRDFPENVPTCLRWNYPLFHVATDLNPAELAGAKRAGAGAPPKTEKDEPWDVDRFVDRFITDTGKSLALLEIEGIIEGISQRGVKKLVDQAVAIGKAFKWGGTPGKPACFALKSESLIEVGPLKRKKK